MASGRRLDPPFVTVQFRVNAEPTYGTEATAEIAGRSDADWATLSAHFPGLTIEPLFGSVAPLAVQAVVDRGRRLTPGYRPARFLAQFQVRLPAMSAWSAAAPQSPTVGRALQTLMFRHLPVDRVTVEEFATEPAVSDGAAGSGAAELHHLHAAPKGLGVEDVWGLTNGKGQGEVLADVERGWKPDHEEFLDSTGSLTITMLPGGQHDKAKVKHGTNALGVAVGRANGKYGIGVAPLASKALLASEYRVLPGADNLEAALYEAIDELIKEAPGSVLLIEMHKQVHPFLSSVATGVYGPCEMKPTIFEVIQLAVANHIVVVEPAGNGAVPPFEGLDVDAHTTLLHGDSGAILVGQATWLPDYTAAATDSAGHHRPVDGGVSGKRIDCFAWGDNVWAASAQEAEATDGVAQFVDSYDAGFGNTSAASALIAGAALVVQGLARASGAYLPPMQMRALLGDRTPGVHTPVRIDATQTTPATDVYDLVGVMPDLKQIAVQLGLLPDLYIRDNTADDGGVHTGKLSKSPDIIVRTTPLGMTPDQAFGAISMPASDDPPSESPIHGSLAQLYVRVRNRGGADVVGAKVTVYWAEPATLIQPAAWLPNKIGETLIDVPQGDTIVVAGPIAWNTVPAKGHYCFLATVEHAQDQMFIPGKFKEWSYFANHIRVDNNIAWRNFDVIELPPDLGIEPLEADVAGPEEGDEQEMELRVEARLPRRATLEIELPEDLAARMSLADGAFTTDRSKKTRRGKLPAGRVARLGLVRLPRGARHRVRLHVDIPSTLRTRPYEVALIQLHRGQPVGRVTWRLEPAASA